MSLTPNQKTILAYLFETKDQLPVDAELNQHCMQLMPSEEREVEIRNLLNTGHLGSQTGFSGFFISSSGQELLLRIRQEEKELRQRYIMKVAGITTGAIALAALLFFLFR